MRRIRDKSKINNFPYYSFFLKKNKRAQAARDEVPGWLVSLLLLAVIVVIIYLVAGPFRSTISNLVGGNTLSSVENGCQTACQVSKDASAWCDQDRTVKFGSTVKVTGLEGQEDGIETSSMIATCDVLAKKTGSVTIKGDSHTATGLKYEGLKSNFNIARCPEITCASTQTNSNQDTSVEFVPEPT